MSIQHVAPARAAAVREPQAMLFTPGARLGWIFRDRRTLLAPYPEPEPDLDKLREQAAASTAAAQARYARARRWAGKPSLIAAIVLVLLAGRGRGVRSEARLRGGRSPGFVQPFARQYGAGYVADGSRPPVAGHRRFRH